MLTLINNTLPNMGWLTKRALDFSSLPNINKLKGSFKSLMKCKDIMAAEPEHNGQLVNKDQ